MTEMLSAAVIGAGQVSEEHLGFLAGSALARPVGVCDQSPAMARYAAERFNAGKPFIDHRDMLSSLRPDVVHVLTPPHTHVPIVRDCLEAGAHVIAEKPLAPTLPEVEGLLALADRCGRWLVEDHNYRFNKPILQMEQLVAAGRLGELREVAIRLALNVRNPAGRYGDANVRHPSHDLPAGIVHEFLPHLCYLALRFMPAVNAASGRPWRAKAAWSNHGADQLFKYDDLDATVICGQVHAHLRFTSGTWPDAFTIELHGTGGAAVADLFCPHLRLLVPRGLGRLDPLVNLHSGGRALKRAAWRGLGARLLQKTPYEGLHELLRRVYDGLHNGGSPPVTRDDMARTSLLIDTLLDEANRV